MNYQSASNPCQIYCIFLHGITFVKASRFLVVSCELFLVIEYITSVPELPGFISQGRSSHSCAGIADNGWSVYSNFVAQG